MVNRRTNFKFEILNLKLNQGFTIIELLVVMAVLGILATIIIISINPFEQLARSRDASRKQAISQIGRAIDNYMAFGSDYPAPTSLQSVLESSSDLKIFPTNPDGVSGHCSSTSGQGAMSINGYCYNATSAGSDPRGAIIYTPLESMVENKNCSSGVAWYAWSSQIQGAGIVCTTDLMQEPSEVLTEFN
jgi:prepilin-type N-terminal cleavage/methylation domain-containing protein